MKRKKYNKMHIVSYLIPEVTFIIVTLKTMLCYKDQTKMDGMKLKCVMRIYVCSGSIDAQWPVWKEISWGMFICMFI